MLRTHLLLALRVMWRRRFFTGISLLGVAGTLMLAVVVVTFFDHALGPYAPESRVGRMLFVRLLKQQFRGDGGWNNSPVSSWYVDTYLRPMRTPTCVAIITAETDHVTAFGTRGVVELQVRYADANYWRVMDFHFLAGRPPTAAEVSGSEPVLVISAGTAARYFGTATGVVGRTLVEPLRYRVVGVVPDVPGYRINSAADAWAPAPLADDDYRDGRLAGPFTALLLAPTPAAVPAMRAEYDRVVARVAIPDPHDVAHIYSYADPLLGSLTRIYFGEYQRLYSTDLSGRFVLQCLGAGLLFLALAALSLVNLTVTRLLERNAEIGVRRAFGAPRGALMRQFLFENLVLTGIGGLLGLALAQQTLALLNRVTFVENSHLALNARVASWALLLTLFFGLLSGVYPAWKMARLSPARALHGRE